MPLGDLVPMPATNCGAVLHLRPDYPDGYLLMLVSAKDDEPAWARFQKACDGLPGPAEGEGQAGAVCPAAAR